MIRAEQNEDKIKVLAGPGSTSPEKINVAVSELEGRQAPVVEQPAEESEPSWRENLSAGARVAWDSLSERSKGIFKTATEKVIKMGVVDKWSNGIERIGDKIKVYRAEEVGRKTQEQLRGTEEEIVELTQKKTRLAEKRSSQEQTRSELLKVSESLGLKAGTVNESESKREMDELVAQEQKMGEFLAQKQEELKAKKERVAEHEKNIAETRRKIDAKLGQKMEINNQRIGALEGVSRDSAVKIEQNNSELAGLREQEKFLMSVLADPEARKADIKLAKETLMACRDKQKAVVRKNSEHEEQMAKFKKETEKLKSKNSVLQERRDEALGLDRQKEKQAEQSEEEKQPANKSEAKVGPHGEISVQGIGERVATLYGNQLTITGRGSTVETVSGDDISDEELYLFMGDKSVREIINEGAHLDRVIIERMQKLEEKRNESRDDHGLAAGLETQEGGAETEIKHSLGEVVGKWNKYLQEYVVKGQQIEYLKLGLNQTNDDPVADLSSADAIIRELKTRVAANLKLKRNELPKDVISKIYNFLQELDESNLE